MTKGRIQELITIIKNGIEQDGRDFIDDLDWSDLVDSGVLTEAELDWCQTYFDLAVTVVITVAQ